MSNPIFDYRPQISSEEYGPEPNVRELVKYYYTSHGIDPVEANNLTEQYIEYLEYYFDKIFSAIGSN